MIHILLFHWDLLSHSDSADHTILCYMLGLSDIIFMWNQPTGHQSPTKVLIPCIDQANYFYHISTSIELPMISCIVF